MKLHRAFGAALVAVLCTTASAEELKGDSDGWAKFALFSGKYKGLLRTQALLTECDMAGLSIALAPQGETLLKAELGKGATEADFKNAQSMAVVYLSGYGQGFALGLLRSDGSYDIAHKRKFCEVVAKKASKMLEE